MPGVRNLVDTFEARSSASSNTSVPPPARARFIQRPQLHQDQQQRRQSLPAPGHSGYTNPFEERKSTVVRNPSTRGSIASTATLADAGEQRPTVHSSLVDRPQSSLHKPSLLDSPQLPQASHVRAVQAKRASLPARTRDSVMPVTNPFLSLSSPSRSHVTTPSSIPVTPSRPIYSAVPSIKADEPTSFRASLVPSYNSARYDLPPDSDDFIPMYSLDRKTSMDQPLLPLHRTSLASDISNSPPPPYSPHNPIPAKEVFSRKAPPLHLPALDQHLGSIPEVSFRQLPHRKLAKNKKGKEKAVPQELFPPFEMLQGKTVDELLHNSPLPSVYNDKNSILNSLMNGSIGLTGSSALADYYSLQGVYDSIQIFALILNSVVPRSSLTIGDKWRELFLSTIPNILALNIPTKLQQSLIFLTVMMVVCAGLLYQFHLQTAAYSPRVIREGRQPRHPPFSWTAIVVTFLLTVLYLPLSTIAMHGIIWSSDFWPVENPYLARTQPANLPDLGPASQWREPTDFCYTTTMRKDEGNWAPLIVLMCATCFIFMAIWFPIRLMYTIRQSLPIIDPYTELGKKRSNPELELEYQRKLDRDTNPFSFLYRDFRRRWATYKSVHLWAKLVALLIVAIISPDNCAFRNFNHKHIDVIRQSILTLSTLVWFVLQCLLGPFLGPVDNASEWTSRASYVVTSCLGLLVAMGVPGKEALDGVVLYIVYIITYGMNIHFSIIHTGIMKRFVKRMARRIDFSIDIYNPRLDVSPHSPHLRRRIWQESLTALLLTDSDCKIPAGQKMQYADSQDLAWPPYLLGFQQSPGERHAENIKILREVGLKRYARGIALVTGPESYIFKHLQRKIEKHFVGPDCFWKPLDVEETDFTGCKAYFGNAWWIPFPPTLVISYDNGGQAILQDLHELESYVIQNESPSIEQRRGLRLALRSLDRQIVVWPYTHVEMVGSRTWFTGRQYSMAATTHFHSCVFELKRRGLQDFNGLPIGSGFEIQLTYSKEVQLDGDILGLNDDYDLTPLLAKFLHINQHLIQVRLSGVERVLKRYRKVSRRETRGKRQSLSYSFLTDVWNWPSSPEEVAKTVSRLERDLRLRQLVVERENTFASAEERMGAVTRSEVCAWWYLFWDDFWRRNHDVYGKLRQHATDFDPHYSTSIAYRPLPRAALEAFLVQRGLFSGVKGKLSVLHHGFLNKMYFRLNQIAFHGTDKAILVHVGRETPEIDLEDLDMTTHVRTSTMGTGGATDHDDGEIRARPAFKWEEVFEDPMRGGKSRWAAKGDGDGGGQGGGGEGETNKHWVSRRRWGGRLKVWLGITPLERRQMRTNGIALDLRVQGGRFVVLERTVLGTESETEPAAADTAGTNAVGRGGQGGQGGGRRGTRGDGDGSKHLQHEHGP